MLQITLFYILQPLFCNTPQNAVSAAVTKLPVPNTNRGTKKEAVMRRIHTIQSHKATDARCASPKL